MEGRQRVVAGDDGRSIVRVLGRWGPRAVDWAAPGWPSICRRSGRIGGPARAELPEAAGNRHSVRWRNWGDGNRWNPLGSAQWGSARANCRTLAPGGPMH